MVRDIGTDEVLTYEDVELVEGTALRLRREQDAAFASAPALSVPT